jgi:hypothetical protein
MERPIRRSISRVASWCCTWPISCARTPATSSPSPAVSISPRSSRILPSGSVNAFTMGVSSTVTSGGGETPAAAASRCTTPCKASRPGWPEHGLAAVRKTASALFDQALSSPCGTSGASSSGKRSSNNAAPATLATSPSTITPHPLAPQRVWRPIAAPAARSASSSAASSSRTRAVPPFSRKVAESASWPPSQRSIDRTGQAAAWVPSGPRRINMPPSSVPLSSVAETGRAMAVLPSKYRAKGVKPDRPRHPIAGTCPRPCRTPRDRSAG